MRATLPAATVRHAGDTRRTQLRIKPRSYRLRTCHNRGEALRSQRGPPLAPLMRARPPVPRDTIVRMTLTLTEQQQAVVGHNHGPALVFAVAGAGKTTAMVHRIERLVRDGLFAPNQILATSFGRANIADLRRALQPWPHCADVDVRTLHSLAMTSCGGPSGVAILI
jgi:hypothetical protein